MELIQYIRLFRRWFWLIFLAAFVAGSVSFVVRSSQPATYQAQTRIAIGGFIQAPNPDASEIRTGVELAQTYVELARTFNVMQATVDALNLPFSADRLRSIVTTRITPGTSLLVLSVEYSDPVLAADIANEVTRQLILESPTNLTTAQQSQIDIANNEIARLNDQLDTLRLQLDLVNERASNNVSDSELNRLTDERTTLIDQINQTSSNIAQFTNTIASLQQRTNSLEIVESARIPTSPVGTSVVNAALLGAMVGAALAGGVVLLIEYLNDTFRSADEVTQTLGLPVLGVISRFGKAGDSYPERLITHNLLFSRTPEEYRTLRTNLLYSTSRSHSNIYVITSPAPQEGKSITTSNLGVSMALAEQRVLLIDADLRRPKLHDIFRLKNNLGLTTLLSMDADEVQNGKDWQTVVQRTHVPNLSVITSGFIPQNPTEALGSVALRHWLDVFVEELAVDVILFDSPPCLTVADSAVLAASVNANVIMVVEAGSTRRTIAQRAKERFAQIGHEVTGVILNATNPRDEDYYGYYSYYYQSPEKQPSKQP
jgi:polysaccharide biosynthesis transport protein